MDARSGLSIAVIEDDAHFRETFSDVMSLRGVKVRGAGTAVAGLAMLAQERPDIVIVDVRLPDLHGFELCRRIRRDAALSGVPVILISASTRYNDPRDRVEGLLAGAAAFLPKPITIEDLWAQICGVLGQKAPELA